MKPEIFNISTDSSSLHIFSFPLPNLLQILDLSKIYYTLGFLNS